MSAPQKSSLAYTHPKIAAQADGWDPTTVTFGSNKNLSWKCELGHKWKAQPVKRSRGDGCPYCRNKKLLVGFNDLATTNPDLAAQADGWDPTTFTAGSGHKLDWICELGHKWKAIVLQRNRGGSCPICLNQRVQVGYNDLATTNPDLAAQADGWDPTTVTAGTHKKLDWKCELGHKWKANGYSRSGGRGCPFCSGKAVLAGFNDLATTNPDLAAQADGWDATTTRASSNKIFNWKCELGHKWKASGNNRVAGKGCGICSGRFVLAGFNDLATTNPDLAAQADGWDPTTATKCMVKRFNWKCELGHKWKASPNERSRYGCPTCSKSGFDPNKPGFLYLLDHFDLNMFQIGISNTPKNRLGDHKRGGWEVIELRGPMDGHLTQKLETDCLHALEKRGAILGHKAEREKFDGYTEAWTKKSLNVTSIKQILDWVYEDEAK